MTTLTPREELSSMIISMDETELRAFARHMMDEPQATVLHQHLGDDYSKLRAILAKLEEKGA